MSDQEFLARARERMKELKVSQAEMARTLGLPSQSALSNIFNGKRKLTFMEALEMERFLDMERADKARQVPIIGMASASSWNEAVLMPLGKMPIACDVAGKRAFAIQVKGDSIDKLVHDGGYVIIDPDERGLFSGRFYLIQNGDNEVTVKRYFADPARFEPASSNPLHNVINMGEHMIQVIGRVVWAGFPV